MMKITGISHLFKWENLHNWWLTKYFFAPLYVLYSKHHLNYSCFLTFHTVITCTAPFIPNGYVIDRGGK